MDSIEAGTALPREYQARLSEANLRPLWTAPVKNAMTAEGQPLRTALPAHWPYRIARDHLLHAGELVTVEEAERRVLVCINPGYTAPGALGASATIYAALQIVLPGEVAPSHRHSAGASRFIIEGGNAYTAVNGERFSMAPGDLILTPPHHWHEHVHEGDKPVIWLDILDLPLCVPADAMHIVIGSRTADSHSLPERRRYGSAGLVPFRSPLVAPRRYPMMHYRWSDVRATLVDAAAGTDRADPVHMMYVNPDTGDSVLESYCFSVRMVRPGEEIAAPLTSSGAIFHVIEGDGQSEIDGASFDWAQGDILAAPTMAPVRHRNRSSTRPAFLLQVDDAPMQHKLGWYEERASPACDQ